MNPKSARFARKAIFFFLALSVVVPAAAEIRLPAVWGDHMVVQRDRPIAVWGWASPQESVQIRFSKSETRARAGNDGFWKATLPPEAAGGGPRELFLRGERGGTVLVRDILVGEVWLCSGQSNMEWPLSQAFAGTPEVLRADHPEIRLFLVPKRTAPFPLENIEAKWTDCTPRTARSFSAVAYYFGLELHRKLGLPVGLIESAWGGTEIEPWTPPAGFAAVSETKPILAAAEARTAEYRLALRDALPSWEAWVRELKKALNGKGDLPLRPDFPAHPMDDPRSPSALYNGMIHPLIRFAIRGAIWYQGESNRNDGLFYEKKMEALIRGWRGVWNLGDFPFYYVQLAPYQYPFNREIAGGDIPDFLRLPLIWEAQANILRLPATGMAVVTDITDLNDIHPRNKKDVGSRLALWARARTYGEPNLVYSGPLFREFAAAGDRARITFDHAEGGLISADGRPLTWFEIAGEDRIFFKAEAEIEGATVLVRSPRVPAPAAVRFGWHQAAVPNLANAAGLPASPFRTDRW